MRLETTPVVRPGATKRPPLPARQRIAATAEPNAVLVGREPVGSTIVRLHVRPDGGVPAFNAGQYFALGLDGGGGFVQRPYSTSSAPGERDTVTFLVRLVAGGALTPRLWTLRPGARLRLGPPKGLFAAPVADRRRPLLIGTGTGIAPLVSILGAYLGDGRACDHGSRPIVIQGASFAADLADRSRLAELEAAGRISYIPAVSRPSDPANAGWGGATGRLDGLVHDVMATCGLDPDATVAYICGNPLVVDAVARVLAGSGLPADAIRTEAWS